MVLSETKAKGMMTSFLKCVENDLSMLSCHLYGHLAPFHSLLIANQNYHTQLPTYLSFIHFLFCLLDINISFVLSIFIVIPFSRHHILVSSKSVADYFLAYLYLNQYHTMLYHQHINLQIELNPQ